MERKQITQKKRILLVEDDLVSQIYIKTLLNENGFEVKTVNNGKDALEYYKREKFDLVIMDIQIPIVNGMEVTRRIREKEELKKFKIPIIALTGYAYEEDKKLFIDSGMNACITKPIDESLLLESILELLRK